MPVDGLRASARPPPAPLEDAQRGQPDERRGPFGAVAVLERPERRRAAAPRPRSSGRGRSGSPRSGSGTTGPRSRSTRPPPAGRPRRSTPPRAGRRRRARRRSGGGSRCRDGCGVRHLSPEIAAIASSRSLIPSATRPRATQTWPSRAQRVELEVDIAVATRDGDGRLRQPLALRGVGVSGAWSRVSHPWAAHSSTSSRIRSARAIQPAAMAKSPFTVPCRNAEPARDLGRRDRDRRGRDTRRTPAPSA